MVCHFVVTPQARFLQSRQGWYWSVLDVGGDSKRLRDWGDDDLVVISSNGADMEPHVARRHVKASAKGVVNLGAGILEDTLVAIDGRGDVNRGRYCILHVCQELLLSIEAGACSKDCWVGLGLGTKNRPHEGPDAVVQALYPGRGETQALVFWLQEISQLRKQLEDERDKRSQLYKKYRRGINAVDAVDKALISASVGMSIGGVGLLATIIAAPVVLGLEIAALGCGLLGVAGKFIGRRFLVKAKRHDEVRILAESKLSTIADHVSKALRDGTISDEEFRLVVEETQKYA